MQLEREDSLHDVKSGKVKHYNPDDNSVIVLVGSGHNSSFDGTQDSCSFKQIKGICSVDKTLFVTDVYCWKSEDRDKAWRNDIFSGDSWLPLRYVWNSF